MNSVLGEEAEWVLHALIPYEIGGSLDSYYYRSPTSGTAVATKELSLLPHQGPSNDRLTTYELVGFMRGPFAREDVNNPNTPAGIVERRLRSFLNLIARYSEEATLNRFETCAIPTENVDESEYPLVVFDEFARFEIDANTTFGLLAVIEILPTEFEYKQQYGGDALIDLLKQEGVYPFTEPDRTPVV
ncbi:suppressor of fused domain protein [Botrimarina sp.]|uniref:suppressor of fused domain protein n=1 Tax=Botrimarina sp. TaxID=2795802 RepID=UPI0032EB3F0B